MKKIEYALSKEGYVNRFMSTGTFISPQKFKKVLLQGRINEWLKKGFSIHENPCRKEFIEKRRGELPPYLDISRYIPGQEVGVFDLTRKLELYFPFGNIGYEDSGFYYCPTYLRTYCFAWLEAEMEETASFELETCGGLTIWNNEELITDYIPFTRNMVKRERVEIPLKKGSNKLILCLDDLAERDTDYYFRLRYEGGQVLRISLPVADDANVEKINRYEQILHQIYFNKEAYISEPVVLTLPSQLMKADDMKLTISHGEFVEKMINMGNLDHIKQYKLQFGQKDIILMQSEDMLPGYYHFLFEMSEGPVKIKRKIGNQLVWKKLFVHGSDSIRERKQQILETIMEYGSDNAYKAAAYYEKGCCYDMAEKIILEEIAGVHARQDCSDFHFTTILFIYFRFYDKLSEKLKSAIKEAALNYRYWIDEPGDDVMWFFSENHALLFHTCQYLAGTLFADQRFTNSGKSGSEVSLRGRELLDDWFEGFFEEFITEWNSNAYIPVDVHGIATLYNITDTDDALHQKAKKAMDMVCYSLAANAHKGAVMTSFGRTYEKEMKGNYNAGTTSLLYLFYNAGYLTRAAIGNISVALSDYEAPAEYRKYLELDDDEHMIFENTQGFEKHADLYMYKNNQVQLSTAMAFKPFQPGYQEHIMQATIDETAQVFINHPGESHPYGSGRPNFWAGNGRLPLGLQHRNLGILIFDIPDDNRIDYTHAYIPLSEFQQYKGVGDAVVVGKQDGFIGIRAMNGLTMQKSGPTAYREFISRGRKNVWVVKVMTANELGSLEEFLEDMNKMMIDMKEDGGVLVADQDQIYQITPDMELLVGGEARSRYPLDVKGKIVIERNGCHE